MKNSDVSHYYWDGKKVDTKELTERLKGRGIDLDHNRFLILQGEVESISLMKPKSTKEDEESFLSYLEDIIGVTHYQEPIAAKETEVGVQISIFASQT